MTTPKLSLADFVILSAKRTRAEPVRKALALISEQLTGSNRRMQIIRPVIRMTYDSKVTDILDKLSAIPFKDFVKQFDRIIMPFDTFWIEEVLPEDKPRLTRRGAILRKRADSEIIEARFAMELQMAEKPEFPSELFPFPGPKVEGRSFPEMIGMYIRDRRYVASVDMIVLFSRDGMSIQNNSVLKSIGLTPAPFLNMAEDMFRLLVLVSSHNVQTNFIKRSTGQEAEKQERSITKYKGYRGAPIPSTIPIEIDLAKSVTTALLNNDASGVKKLLGWTDVIRHRRTYHTLQGPIEKIIEPHERRIQAPVDHRGAARAITSSDPDLSINVKAERPKLISWKPNKGRRPTPKR